MRRRKGNFVEPTEDYVRKKIKGYVKKTGRKNSRARKAISASLAPIIKKSKSIAELFTDEDREQSYQAIKEAKQANHVYITKDGIVEVPDHKTRLAAVALERAYDEGTPIARSISAHADFKDFPDLIDRLNSSAAFRESYASLQKPVDCKEVTPALPPHDAATG
jgi:hypothetical protein